MRWLTLASIVAAAMLAVAPTFTPTDAFACIGASYPSKKIAAIDEALPTSEIAAAELAGARELRQKAYSLAMDGRLAEAHAAADLALTILGVTWIPPQTRAQSRC
jgi:hypothetical protein